MRNPNRLYDFYDKLRDIHIEYFPDWRFGQFMTNFLKTCQRCTEKEALEILEKQNKKL